MGVASYLLHTWPITSPVVNLVISATWQRTFMCTPCFHLLIVPSPQVFFFLLENIHKKLHPHKSHAYHVMSRLTKCILHWKKKKNQITSTSNNFISANWCLSLCGKRPPHFALHGLKPFALYCRLRGTKPSRIRGMCSWLQKCTDWWLQDHRANSVPLLSATDAPTILSYSLLVWNTAACFAAQTSCLR